MRRPRITRATLGLACSKCNRLLSLRERYLRDEAANAFAPICEPCAAPLLARKPTSSYRHLCDICKQASSWRRCVACAETMRDGLARIAPYRLPVPRV